MPMYNQGGPAAYQQNQQGRQDDQFRQILQMMMMGMQQKTQQGQYADQMKQQQLSNEMAEKNYALDERNIASQEAYRNRPQTGELSSDAKTIEYLMAKGIVKTPQEGWQYLMQMKQGGISPNLMYQMGRAELTDARREEDTQKQDLRYGNTKREGEAKWVYETTVKRLNTEIAKLERKIASDPYGYKITNRDELVSNIDNLNKTIDFISERTSSSLASGGMGPDTKKIMRSIAGDLEGVKAGKYLDIASEALAGSGSAPQAPTAPAGIPPEVEAYMKKHPDVPAEEVMAMYDEYMKTKK